MIILATFRGAKLSWIGIVCTVLLSVVLLKASSTEPTEQGIIIIILLWQAHTNMAATVGYCSTKYIHD